MTIVPYFLVLIPGLYAWWAGRRLVSLIGDAAFSEITFSQAKRQLHVLLGTWVAILLLAWTQALWLMPLALVASLAGTFPARRAILDEEWGFIGYFSYQMRLLLGFLGPWLLVFTAPLMFEHFAGALPYAVGALTLTVAVWGMFGGAVLLWILRARPLEDPQFEEHFERVLSGAVCRRPRVYRAGPRGGTLVNGLALPTPWAPAVILSEGLLEHFTPDEAGGIFAHEVAHLEQYTPRRWWSRIAVGPVLVLLLGLVYLTVDMAVFPTAVIAIGWPVFCLLLLAMSLSRSREDETAADLRAVELGGDAGSVIDALTKVHVLNRHPRRVDPAQQERMTHPSLARRLQAIRDAIGSVAPAAQRPTCDWDGDIIPIDDPLVLRAAKAEQAIALRHDRITIFDHVDPAHPAENARELAGHAEETRSIRYGALIGLRIDASGPHKRNLVITDRRRKKTVIPIAIIDAAALQARLDRIDRFLGRPDEKPLRTQTSDPMRLIALVAALLGVMSPISVIFALAALAAFAWPTASALVAAGAVGLVQGISLLAQDGGWQGPDYWVWVVAGQLVAGLVLLTVGIRRLPRQETENTKGQWIALGILLPGVPLVIIKALAAMSGPLPAMQLHLWSGRTPAAVFLLALGMALIVRPKVLSRVSGVGLLLMSFALGVASTGWFRARSTSELFLEPPGRLVAQRVDPAPTRYLTLEGSAADIALSRDGRIAARLYPEDDEAETPSSQFFIEFEGSIDVLSAVEVAWADDGSILLLQSGVPLPTLTRLDRRGRASWVQQLPVGMEPRVSTYGEAWSVVARDTAPNAMVGGSGYLVGPNTEWHSWRLPDSAGQALSAVSPGLNAGPLMVGALAPKVYHSAVANMLFYTMSTTTSVWRPDSAGPHPVGLSAFYLQCEPARGGHVCSASARNRIEFWSLDDHTIAPIGSVPGWHWVDRGSGGLVIRDMSPVVRILDLDTHRTFEFDSRSLAGFPADGSGDAAGEWGAWSQSFAYRPSTLAVARSRGDSTAVVVYQLGRASEAAVVANAGP